MNAMKDKLAKMTAESDSRIARLQARVSELEGHLAAPVAPQPVANSKPSANVTDVRFKDYANVSRIEVVLSGDAKFEILEQREDKAVLLVHKKNSLVLSLLKNLEFCIPG